MNKNGCQHSNILMYTGYELVSLVIEFYIAIVYNAAARKIKFK